MAHPSVLGDIHTGDELAINRVIDMAPMVVYLEETDRAAFTTFLDSCGVRPVYNHEFRWLTKERVPKTHTLGPGAGPGLVPPGGVIAQYAPFIMDLSGLSTEVYVRENDILKSPDSGELFRVDVTPSAGQMDQVSVQRNLEGTAVAFPALAPGDQITRISNAVPENSLLSDSSGGLNSITTQVVDNFNFTQTLRDPVGMSRREQDAKLYSGPNRPFQRAEKLIDHAEQIENALWHSVRTAAATAGGDDTLMGGMINAVQNYVTTPGANTFAVGGNLDEDDWDAFLRVFSRYGNTSKKKFFSSRFVCEVISRFIRTDNNYRVQAGTSGQGTAKAGTGMVTSYASGTGTMVDIIPTRALEGIPGSQAGLGASLPGTWDSLGVLIDPEHVKLAKYGDCYMQLEVDVQLPGQDGIVDAYKSDVGLQWGNPNHHALLTDVQG